MGQCHSQNIIQVMCLSRFVCFTALVMERHTGPRCLPLKKLLNAHLTTCSFRVLNSSSDEIFTPVPSSGHLGVGWDRGSIGSIGAWFDSSVKALRGFVQARGCSTEHVYNFVFPSESPSYRGPNRAMKSLSLKRRECGTPTSYQRA